MYKRCQIIFLLPAEIDYGHLIINKKRLIASFFLSYLKLRFFQFLGILNYFYESYAFRLSKFRWRGRWTTNRSRLFASRRASSFFLFCYCRHLMIKQAIKFALRPGWLWRVAYNKTISRLYGQDQNIYGIYR